jgi:hypothetical protein
MKNSYEMGKRFVFLMAGVIMGISSEIGGLYGWVIC